MATSLLELDRLNAFYGDSHVLHDVSWQLDQMSGLKHPNDQLPNPLPPFQDGPLIRLVDWPSTGGIGTISAGFEIRWQHNGQSLGNVQINNVASQDAALTSAIFRG